MIAQPPFDDVDADFVLHTSDHVNFRVFRRILILSSPFFQSMFTLPQPSIPRDNNSTSNDNGPRHNDETTLPPSVDVPEDSQTLDTLLRFLYPNTHVRPFENLVHAHNVATAATKYIMSTALDKIIEKIQAQYVASRPLEAYLLAWRMGWENVAKAAARYCLNSALVIATTAGDQSDVDTLVRGGILDYPDVGIAYYRLEAYRSACRQALKKSIKAIWSFDDAVPCSEQDNAGLAGISGKCLGSWMAQYLMNVTLAVVERPSEDTLDQLTLPISRCSRCNIDEIAFVAVFRQSIASELERVFATVRRRNE